MTDNDFSFVCCWTCEKCTYDIGRKSHVCMNTGSTIVRPHKPTSCVEWQQHPTHIKLRPIIPKPKDDIDY